MSRVKRGTQHVKRRRNLLRRTKGYRWGRKKLIRHAKTAVLKAGVHSYRDRRIKKRTMRRLWAIKLNAALRSLDTNYSTFIGKLNKAHIAINRKVLAELAEHHPEVLKALVSEIQ